ncbi:MAG: class I SAM-dependent methyltransferase, partial [Candidatus Promineifilaceae bacterium]|nr:class I SAM-dependent methyltransferase [Candidatus Promineifilaceae bacterium]
KFNHDEDAPDYDQDVRNEEHPIRAGYRELLDWVAAQAEAAGEGPILELGSGTGNLTQLLPPAAEVTCVDISQEMMHHARAKLAERRIISIDEDILAFFDEPKGPYRTVVSTYTIHHLTEEEKALLFEKIAFTLAAGGTAVFGDLMFANREARETYQALCRATGKAWLAEDIDDEFFWNIETAVAKLQSLDFELQTKQFSALSWGIVASKRS